MHRAMSEFEGKAENRRKFLRLTPPDARIEPAGQTSRPDDQVVTRLRSFP